MIFNGFILKKTAIGLINRRKISKISDVLPKRAKNSLCGLSIEKRRSSTGNP